MRDIVPSGGTESPFDAIKRTDERGEHWTGRDLMLPLGYGADWRNFNAAIDRASAACANSGHNAADHFTEVFVGANENPQRRGGRPKADVRLTRYAAYLVAMNGDPRKPEIAAAQTYFAAKTREAEVTQAATRPLPQSFSQALRLAAEQQEQIEAQATQLAIAAPKAAYVDAWCIPGEDTTIIEVVAGSFGLTDHAFRVYLRDQGILKRRTVHQYRDRNGKQKVDYEWLACAGYQDWFTAREQLDAPRMRNGQTRTTLYFTHAGKEAIREYIRRHPVFPAEQLTIDGSAA